MLFCLSVIFILPERNCVFIRSFDVFTSIRCQKQDDSPVILPSSYVCVLDQLPELHKLMIEACTILNIEEAPDLYMRQSPVPNAYTLAISGKKPFVVVHTSLVELLTQKELQVFDPTSFGMIDIFITLFLLCIQLYS